MRLTAAVILSSSLSLAGAAALAAQTPSHYVVTKTVPLGTPDRWDYVTFDALTHRVYVAHGDRITVVDGRDGSLVGEVTGYSGGTHGIVIVHAAGRGYTDDGRAGEAGSFDLATLKPLKRIQAGADADAIAFDSKSGHVFVINGDAGTITVIDPAADAAIATVNVGGKLEFAVADGTGKLFVNGEERREIVRIDTAKNEVDARWPIPTCASPHGLAIDSSMHRLFSSCVNSVLVVVNSDTGALVSTLPIGRGTDAAAFDPKRKLVFSSNGGDGTLSVLLEKDAQTFAALDSVRTAASARTMSLDPETGRLYLVAGDRLASSDKGIVPGSLKLLILDPGN